jgi:hypothetical protein
MGFRANFEPLDHPHAVPFSDCGQQRREISAAELGVLLSGIDLSPAERRKRYRRGVSRSP